MAPGPPDPIAEHLPPECMEALGSNVTIRGSQPQFLVTEFDPRCVVVDATAWPTLPERNLTLTNAGELRASVVSSLDPGDCIEARELRTEKSATFAFLTHLSG